MTIHANSVDCAAYCSRAFRTDRQQVSFSIFCGHFLGGFYASYQCWISVGLNILSAQVVSLSRISLAYQVNDQARFIQKAFRLLQILGMEIPRRNQFEKHSLQNQWFMVHGLKKCSGNMVSNHLAIDLSRATADRKIFCCGL